MAHPGRIISLESTLLAALLLSGCSSGPTIHLEPEEVRAYAPLAPQREIRILTINAWSGLDYEGILEIGRCPDDPESRYRALVEGIRSIDPDVIAIQEANPLPWFARRLAQDIGYEAVFKVALGGIRLGPVGIPWNLREGDAILVKRPWTLVELGSRQLSGLGFTSNGCCFQLGEITQVLLARVLVNGKPLHVYALHLHAGPSEGPALDQALERLRGELPAEAVTEAWERVEGDIARRRSEILRLKEFLADTLPPGMPAVVLGDFNTQPESGELAPLLQEGEWVDSFVLKNPGAQGWTWDPFSNPNIWERGEALEPYDRLVAYHDARPSRIDLILLRGNIPEDRVVESRVVLAAANGAAPSDHFGVLTTLRW